MGGRANWGAGVGRVVCKYRCTIRSDRCKYPLSPEKVRTICIYRGDVGNLASCILKVILQYYLHAAWYLHRVCSLTVLAIASARESLWPVL